MKTNKIILKTRENIDNRGSLWEILKSDKKYLWEK